MITGLALARSVIKQGTFTEEEDWVELNPLYLLFRSTSFAIEDITCIFTEQGTLKRRSIVLSLSIQLVFPVYSILALRGVCNHFAVPLLSGYQLTPGVPYKLGIDG
jgi:hypothetical protein